jgi:putative dehydrogenase
MGAGIAATLRRKGHHVHVCDVRPAPAGGLRRRRRRRLHGSPAEVAAACDVLVSVVVNAQQTEQRAVRRRRCGRGDAAGQRRRHVFDGGPEWSAALESGLAERGLLYLDAPISGGAAKAARAR